MTLRELVRQLTDLSGPRAKTPIDLLAGRIEQHGLRPDAAEYETFPRTFQAANVTLTSGRLHMVAIWLPEGKTLNSITFLSGGTGATTPTVQRFGLFDSARVLLAKTLDDGTTAWSATTPKTLALTASFTTTYEGLHYLGILVAAATPNNIRGIGGGSDITGLVPILSGSADTGLTDMPATAAALSAQASIPYGYVS